MKKKIAIALLSSMLVCGVFVGCGSGDNSVSSTTTTSSEASSSSSVETTNSSSIASDTTSSSLETSSDATSSSAESTPTLTKSEVKKKAKKYTYKQIARDPDKYEGKYAKFTGKVIQVLESGNFVEMRVNVTKNDYGYYDDTIYVTYTRDDKESRILEDDIITVYGKLGGLYSYESVMGSTITLPILYATVAELVE